MPTVHVRTDNTCGEFSIPAEFLKFTHPLRCDVRFGSGEIMNVGIGNVLGAPQFPEREPFCRECGHELKYEALERPSWQIVIGVKCDCREWTPGDDVPADWVKPDGSPVEEAELLVMADNYEPREGSY